MEYSDILYTLKVRANIYNKQLVLQLYRSIGHIISHLKFTRNRKLIGLCNILLHLKVYITCPWLDFSIHWTKLLWDLLALLCHPHYIYSSMKYTKLCHITELYITHPLHYTDRENWDTTVDWRLATTHDQIALWCNSPDERCKRLSYFIQAFNSKYIHTSTTRSWPAWHLTGNPTALDTLTSEPLTLRRRGAEFTQILNSKCIHIDILPRPTPPSTTIASYVQVDTYQMIYNQPARVWQSNSVQCTLNYQVVFFDAPTTKMHPSW